MRLITIISLFTLLIYSSLFGAKSYQIIDLVPQEGHSISYATSINNKGQVCGCYSEGSYSGIFYWDSYLGFRDIGVRGEHFGGRFSVGRPFINDQGIIYFSQLMKLDSKGTDFQAKFYTWEKIHGIKDLMIPIDKNHNINLISLNNHNQMIFSINDNQGKSKTFFWDNELISIDHLYSHVLINDNQCIFGIKICNDLIKFHYRNLKTGENEDIFNFKGLHATCFDFNNEGKVIGELRTFHNNTYCFTWSQNYGLELTLSESNDFFPSLLNDNGVLVGYEKTGNYKCNDGGGCYFLCLPATCLTVIDKDQKINLNQYFNLEFDLSSPWSLINDISAINNLGMMVGNGTKNGQTQALLILPTD